MASKTQQTDNEQWLKKHGDKLSDSTKRAQWIDRPAARATTTERRSRRGRARS